jgi:hypothetical protein
MGEKDGPIAMARFAHRLVRLLTSVINAIFNLIFAINLLGGIIRFMVVRTGGLGNDRR